MKVAVVILNWNGCHFLQQFLPHVIEHSHSVAEIVVADNGSTDDSIEFLKREFPKITLIKNASNLGFAEGYNQALKNVTADYYILLNSDVEVCSGWITPVIELMEKDKTIAACQPKILSFHHRDEFEFAGAAGGFIDRYGYPFCRGRIMQTIEKDHGQYDDVKRVFWATGACIFVRASAFHQVGGFDERFFAHMEEIDLCWRMQLAGYSIYFCPHSKVYHVGGGTLHKSDPHKTYLNFRNDWMMLYKNLDEKEFRKISGIRLFLDWIAAIKFLFGSGGLKEMKAVLQAHRDFRKSKEELKHVNPASQSVHNQTEALIYNGSIPVDYYLKGKKYFHQLGFSLRKK